LNSVLQQTRKWFLPLLGILTTLLILFLIFTQVDFSALNTALKQARYIYAVPALLLLLISLVVKGLRWHILLGNGFPLIRAFHILNIANLMNGLLPFRMGEAARAYLTTRGENPMPIFHTVSTIVVERLLDVLALLVVIGLALANGPLPVEIQRAGIFATLLVVVGFLVLVILSQQRVFMQKIVTAIFNFLARFGIHNRGIQERFMLWLNHFLDGLKPLTTPRLLFLVLGYTTISWILALCAGFILMLSFFPQASWPATFLYMAASSLSVAVPTPGNLGPFELSILLALNASGYSGLQDTVIAFALFVHGVYLALNAITGIIGLIAEGISLKQLTATQQAIK